MSDRLTPEREREIRAYLADLDTARMSWVSGCLLIAMAEIARLRELGDTLAEQAAPHASHRVENERFCRALYAWQGHRA